MKRGNKRVSSLSKKTYSRLKWKQEIDYETFKKVIKSLNIEYCKALLINQEGIELPSGIGRLIILKNKPYYKKFHSSTTGRRLLNLHSFGYVYKIFYKEKYSLRYPYLFKFRPNRVNIKIPLWKAIMSGTESYYKLRSDV